MIFDLNAYLECNVHDHIIFMPVMSCFLLNVVFKIFVYAYSMHLSQLYSFIFSNFFTFPL